MSTRKAESLVRVIEVAAAQFSAHGYDAVSVSQIAAEARCSSATIYEAFGDKKGLFREALLQRLNPVPELASDETTTSLHPLLAYFTARVWSLSSPEVRNLFLSGGVDAEALRSGFQASVTHDGRLEAVVQEVERCIEAGLLRPGDPRDIAYLMWAGAGFQPIVYGLVFGDDAGFYPVDILRAVFTPLATRRGAGEVRRFLADLAKASPDHEGPAVTRYLREALTDLRGDPL